MKYKLKLKVLVGVEVVAGRGALLSSTDCLFLGNSIAYFSFMNRSE